MDYGEVLTRAWRIIWKHKILWIFGIFAGCSRGGGGGGGNGSRFAGNENGQNPFPQFEGFANQFGDWISNHLWVVALFILFILILVVLSIWLGTMGRIGLILGTRKADAGAERLAFGELWHESTPFFWRIFLLSLLIGLAFLVILLPVLAVGIGFTALTAGLGVLCLIPIICLLIPLGIAVGLLVEIAEPAIVLENLGIMDGLRRGWEVFKAHIGPVLVMWILLGVIGFVVGIVVALPLLAVLIPAAVAFGLGSAQGPNLSYTPLILAGACFVVYLPVLIVLSGILTAYLQSAWTLTYMRLTKPSEVIETPAIQAPNA